MVNEANMRLFVDALRSGEFKQGNRFLGYFQGHEERFCCLGVACEVAIRNGVPLVRLAALVQSYERFIYLDDSGFPEPDETRGIYLHPLVSAWLGVDGFDPTIKYGSGATAFRGTAAGLNDNLNWSFEQIADAFERTYLAGSETPA